MQLNQVTIYSKKVKETLKFYQDLGLILIVDSAPRYVRLACANQGSSLSIHETDITSDHSPITLYFETNDLEGEVKRLENLGYTFSLAPTEQRWLWEEAHLNDPNGNPIILYYAGENRLNPPWRV